jgi:hypothetical protein
MAKLVIARRILQGCILKKRKSGMAGICKGRAAADNRKSSLHILRQVQAALL